jgi:predicted small metal-binding protein
MPKMIRCECGFVARGETDDTVVEQIRSHMASDHPVLLESVSRDDLVSWIQSD